MSVTLQQDLSRAAEKEGKDHLSVDSSFLVDLTCSIEGGDVKKLPDSGLRGCSVDRSNHAAYGGGTCIPAWRLMTL